MSCLLLVACSDDGQQPAAQQSAGDMLLPAGQEVLFEVSHVNQAWGYRLAGHYVDREGRIWQFDHSSEPWQAPASCIPAEALRDKLTRQQEQVGRVSPQELAKAVALVKAAAAGPLGDRVDTGCRDFGGMSYLAYTYDEDEDCYTPVLLHLRGDWGRKNLAPAAAELRLWLDGILGFQGMSNCEP
jgi:hypothetical protein